MKLDMMCYHGSKKCFDVLDDDDESLKFDTHEEFEAEANFFRFSYLVSA